MIGTDISCKKAGLPLSNAIFNTPHHLDYYKEWIFLGSCGGKDYYIKDWPDILPKGQPLWTSVVYGEEPESYMSSVLGVAELLNPVTRERELARHTKRVDVYPYPLILAGLIFTRFKYWMNDYRNRWGD